MSDTGMDVGKIISLIMENPGIVEQISALASKSGESKEQVNEEIDIPISDTANEEAPTVSAEPVPAPHYGNDPSTREGRRKNLIGALKPYLSPERAKAADSILGVASILEIMRR